MVRRDRPLKVPEVAGNHDRLTVILGMKSPENETHIHGWLQWQRAAGRPETTLRLRSHHLVRLGRDHDLGEVTGVEICEWLAAHSWASETRRSWRASLISFFGWAVAAGVRPDNPTRLVPPVRAGEHVPRPCPEDVLADALAVADTRVRLMLLLGARQGMRRAEIARCRTTDVQHGIGGWEIRILGKGSKVRIMPVHSDVRAMIRMLPEGWCFPGNDCGHLSPHYVGVLVSNVLPKGWTCHTLRHRFGTLVYRGSQDIVATQELMGHASITTTRGYVALDDQKRRAAFSFAA